MYVSMVKNNGNTKTVFFPPGKVSCWGTGSQRGRSQHQRQQLLLRDRQLRLPRVREGGFEKLLQRLQRLFRRWWSRSGSLPCSCCCILPSHLYCSGTGRCFRWIPLLRYYCTRSGGWRCWNHRLFCFLWHVPFHSSQKCPCWGSSRGSLWHQCSWVCSRLPHKWLVVLVAASGHRETTSELFWRWETWAGQHIPPDRYPKCFHGWQFQNIQPVQCIGKRSSCCTGLRSNSWSSEHLWTPRGSTNQRLALCLIAESVILKTI